MTTAHSPRTDIGHARPRADADPCDRIGAARAASSAQNASVASRPAAPAHPVNTAASDPPPAMADIDADPTTVDRAGSAIRDLRRSIAVGAVDRTLLDADTLGHAGLATALQGFVTYWDQRLGEFAEHLDLIGETVDDAGQRYQSSDEAAADTFATTDSSDSSTGHGRGGWSR